jgi:hypothetical protein
MPSAVAAVSRVCVKAQAAPRVLSRHSCDEGLSPVRHASHLRRPLPGHANPPLQLQLQRMAAALRLCC